MKLTPRIEKAIDIFLDAINNNTLAKGTCKACAVGNMVAHGMGITAIIPQNDEDHCAIAENEHWSALFFETSAFKFEKDKGKKCIEATEFSLNEIIAIETAFEHNTSIRWTEYVHTDEKEIRADQINGLKAVVEVMLGFDDVKADVKEIFIDKAEAIPLTCQL